jgi:hypothetical protein
MLDGVNQGAVNTSLSLAFSKLDCLPVYRDSLSFSKRLPKFCFPQFLSQVLFGFLKETSLFGRRQFKEINFFWLLCFLFCAHLFSLYGNIVSINKFVLSGDDTYPNQIYIYEFRTSHWVFNSKSTKEKIVGKCRQ